MMKFLKKTGTLVLALVVLATALLATGCSTPKVAMTVDGTEYTTGEYLAYLYNTFYQTYVNGQLYYYDLYMEGYDVWNESYEFDGKEYNLADYISKQAQETIIRQVAIMRLMDEHGITVSEEDKAEMEEELKTLTADAFLDYGISNDSYIRMFKEYNYNYNALFYTLYGEGGKRAVPAEDIRKYFDDNYLSYKIISYSLVDSEGKELSDKEKTAINDKLNGYLKMYEDKKDFDAVIAQYKVDEAATTTTTTTGSGTTTEAAATTTTTTTTTTTAATTTTTAADDDHDHDHEHEDEETETTTDPNRVDIDSKQTGDAELVKALKDMKFNDVKILEYKNSSGTATKALVLKLDPEADRGEDEDGKPVDYFANQKEAILYQLKNEELNTELEAKLKTLDVEINKRAVNACDPYDFRAMVAGE